MSLPNIYFTFDQFLCKLVRRKLVNVIIQRLSIVINTFTRRTFRFSPIRLNVDGDNVALLFDSCLSDGCMCITSRPHPNKNLWPIQSFWSGSAQTSRHIHTRTYTKFARQISYAAQSKSRWNWTPHQISYVNNHNHLGNLSWLKADRCREWWKNGVINMNNLCCRLTYNLHIPHGCWCY